MEKMDLDKLVSNIEGSIIEDRRVIHSFAEVGFDLPKTKEYVKKRLGSLGLISTEIGGSLVASIENGMGPTVLLRADMDALNIREKTGLPFASENGNMHACGHDMHTSMLLGAANLLSQMHNKIKGRIVFAFQSAEETLEGAKRMLDDGLLDFATPNAALMIHTLVGVELPRETAVVASAGVSAPSADFFRVTVKGESSHGSTPYLSTDALSCGVKIASFIEGLITREIPLYADATISIGTFSSGSAANIIADTANLEGTFRTTDEEAREKIRAKLTGIVECVSKAYGAEGNISFYSGCPTLVNDAHVSRCVHAYVEELIGSKCMYSEELNGRGGGSEDFAYISHKVPSVMVGLVAGSKYDGFNYPLHNSRVIFDENALKLGAKVYAWCAYRYLSEH